ncbi:MAG: cyclic nucleotide-binding domain-containing protein [Thermoplasmata archaeon]|nr:cyclic nucleotide-binding domain-containing protein [Thermoplasmata archaeon]MCI4359057.1 cyclic nucleotide-binding domain-containing protein [Thermoplasmata archaeon]
MEPQFLDLLREKAYLRSFEPGSLLVRENDPAEEFLVIFTGKVALEILLPRRPRASVQTVGPGEVLGWSWLLAPHRWTLDARALEPTLVLGLAASHLRSVLRDRPADGYHFLLRLLPVIAHRLENTRRELLSIPSP